MKRPRFKKKYLAMAATAGLVMGAAGIAAAYFSASGSGSGNAHVGTTVGVLKVTAGSVTGTLYPGGTQKVQFDVTNTGSGSEHFTIGAGNPSTQVLVATLRGYVVTSTTTQAVTGCKSSWFSVSTTAQSGVVQPQSTSDNAFYATVAMDNGTGATGSTQDACRGTSPKLNVSFNPILTSAAAFDGSYSGTNYSWVNLTAPTLGVTPSSLTEGESATFTVTVHSTPNAAEWSGTTAALVIAGFADATESPVVNTLQGDGSLIFAQDNSEGLGYCANNKFYVGSTFDFGTGDDCFSHTTPPGSTVTFSVTIASTGAYTDTVTVAKTGVTPGSGFSCGTSTCTATFTGSVTPTQTYFPALHLLPGRTASAPNDTWTYAVSNSTYSAS